MKPSLPKTLPSELELSIVSLGRTSLQLINSTSVSMSLKRLNARSEPTSFGTDQYLSPSFSFSVALILTAKVYSLSDRTSGMTSTLPSLVSGLM